MLSRIESPDNAGTPSPEMINEFVSFEGQRMMLTDWVMMTWFGEQCSGGQVERICKLES